MGGQQIANCDQALAQAPEVTREVGPAVVEGRRQRAQDLARAVALARNLVVYTPGEKRGSRYASTT